MDVDRLDDLDTYDDVGELDDDNMGELDESVAVEQPGADSVTGSSVSRSSGYGLPDPTPTRSSTGYRPSHPKTQLYSKYVCGAVLFLSVFNSFSLGVTARLLRLCPTAPPC